MKILLHYPILANVLRIGFEFTETLIRLKQLMKYNE